MCGMKLSLITAAIATDFEDPGDAAAGSVRAFSTVPQLGPLSLASVLEARGTHPEVISLDRLYYVYLDRFGSRGLGDFPAWVAPRIAASGAEIYGFSSICSSYPLTLRIAEVVKRLNPGCTILLGGPQASVVDLATLTAFPFVDFILRGEAEQTLPLFLDEWAGTHRFSDVPGLSYRTPFGPVRNPDASVIDDLDELPLPAYHLTGELEGASYALLELGRGCPFACTFCSTNDFFRRKFRVKSPARMLTEMRTIAERHGIRRFELIHDMFTVDRRRVIDFCRHLIDSGETFEWSCSARTDCMDDEQLDVMAASGCVGIFFGVETGSKRMQRIIDKDLDPDRARVIVERADRLGIATTVSLITGFPEENGDDLRETVGVYMHSLRQSRSSPQLNLLAPLAATPIYQQNQDKMLLDDLCSDMSHQGRTQNDADRELIRQYPHIFPNFYLVPAPLLDRAFLLELREFLRAAAVRLRWILTALDPSGVTVLDAFSGWRERRMERYPGLRGGELRHYYMQRTFADEFVSFARERPRSVALDALLSCYEHLRAAELRDSVLPRGRRRSSGRLVGSDFPTREPNLLVLELDCDIQKVIETLKRGQQASPRLVRRFYRTAPSDQGDARLIKITPLVARALQLCDGRHTVNQVVATVTKGFKGGAAFRNAAAGYLLKSLQKNGFIAMYRSASRAEPSHAGAGTKSAYKLASARASEQNQLSIHAR